MKGKVFWKTVSYLFHPLFMPTLGVCFLLGADPSLLFSVRSPYQLLMIPWTVLGATALLPLFCILSLVRAGKIGSLEEPSRHDRLLLIVFTELGFLISFIVLHNVSGTAQSLFLFLLGINIALMATLVLNFITRSSLHATGAGGLLGTVIGLEYSERSDLKYWIGAALVLAFLTGYARYRLKAHKAEEIYLGYLCGLLSLALVFMIGAGK
ncbi:MAG: hypothetical protein HKL88_05240 [Bacteroidia bacterium]|nr:hypothetical protein [Bacteroidia bacterium]